MAVNAEGTEWVARAAREIGALMVYVSTDYVFDGNKREPYTEADEPRPLSHYGKSKLEGERRVADICPGAHLIVRTGWLYGAGKGFVDWALGKLDEGATLRLIDDQVGSPTWAAEAAKALLVLIEQAHSGIFHFVNKGQTHWLGAGRAILECLGAGATKHERASSADWVRPAARPLYSALDVGKFEAETGTRVTPWDQALALYLSSVGRLPRRADDPTRVEAP
jgi:dTDP-4-dehydrorhamnose reductase